MENHGEAKCRGHDSAGAPSGLDGLPPGPSSAAAIFHREDGDDGEKWWFNGGLMVVQWWFNGGSMVVQWWFNGGSVGFHGGSYKVVPQFGIAKVGEHQLVKKNNSNNSLWFMVDISNYYSYGL